MKSPKSAKISLHFAIDLFICFSYLLPFFLALIEEGYHSTNPYHNSIHATDVTQAMHCFLQEEKVNIPNESKCVCVYIYIYSFID